MPTLKWTKIPSKAISRSSHSLNVINGKAYLFGGEIQPRQPVDNAIHKIDISDGSYEAIEAKGEVPDARVGHTAAKIGMDIYVFGGRGGKEMIPLEESGSVYRFSTTSQRWTKLLPQPGSDYPLPRSYASTAAVETQVIIHGGCGTADVGRLNDTWSFDINTLTWTRLADAPGGGRGGTALAVVGERLYRFGGFDGKTEQGGSLDSLDLTPPRSGSETGLWSSQTFAEGDGPPPRSVSALIPIKDKLSCIMGEGKPSITGGHDAAGNFWDDVWVYTLRGGKWEKGVSEGEGPGARGWFAAAAVAEGDGGGGGKGVIWGGLNGGNEREGDGWVLELEY